MKNSIQEINKLEAIEKACRKLELAIAGYQNSPWIMSGTNTYDSVFDKKKKAKSILRKASIEHGIILSGLWNRDICIAKLLNTFIESLMQILFNKNIQKEFNDKAKSFGCKARIGGHGKHPFFEFRNTYDIDNDELWFKIDSQRFVTLTRRYPELHN